MRERDHDSFCEPAHIPHHHWRHRTPLYFVENVQELNDQGSPDEHYAVASLQYIPQSIRGWVMGNRDFKRFVRLRINRRQTEIIQEGRYVRPISDNEFAPGEDDERYHYINNRYLALSEELSKRMVSEAERPIYSGINRLCSYHVNVGHGNHSLIVFDTPLDGTHIWMIDCSDYDYLSSRYYRQNITACLKRVTDRFNLTTPPHIDAVMLTHPHYDHYSGIGHYITQKHIDGDSVFYINLSYPRAIHNFNNLLASIIDLGAGIIEPFSENSGRNIGILYPDRAGFNTRLSPNNISSVFVIQFDGRPYFVFPGDLETKGWNLMARHSCKPHMRQTSFYAISHHGSMNGHLRTCALNAHVSCVNDCLLPDTVPVLLGRDGAYSGIYSPRVISDFGKRILYSEKNPSGIPARFLEIDLLSGASYWG